METLYSVASKKFDHEQMKLEASIILNVEHEIFKGHFPTQPVLPGVCQVEIVEQLLATEFGKSIKLFSASNIKYLKMVDPHKDKKLDFSIGYNKIDQALKVSALIKSGEEVCMKAKLNFKII